MARPFRTRDFQPDPEADISEEIQTHLEMKARELMAEGLSEEEARVEARRRFGDVEEITAEATSHARTAERRRSFRGLIDTLSQDTRYAFRTLFRSPGMTALSILILALGIGANTAIFSVLKAVFMEPIPLPQAEQLTFLWNRNTRTGGRGPSSFPNYLDWKNENSTFQAMGAFGGTNVNLTGGDEPVRIRAVRATASIFEVLGVQPAMGRTLLPEEDLSAASVVVLSDQLWRDRFDGDPGMVGNTIQLDGGAYTVVGIMPPGFVHPTPWGMGDPYLAWIPVREDPWIHNRNSFSYQVLARLGEGVPVGTAQENMNQIGARLEEAFPEINRDNRAWVVPLHALLYGEAAFQIILVLLAAGTVLLIACGNIAGFLLARAAARSQEMAIRAALGASRARVVRQLLTESTLMALAGGVGAVLLASWSMDALKAFIPPTIPRTGNIRLDGTVLLFALLVSLFTGLFFGLIPALSVTRTRITEVIKGVKPRRKRGRELFKAQNVFVVGQLALGLILAHTGLLLIQSYTSLQETEQGFDEEHTLTLGVTLGGDAYDSPEERQAFFDQLIPRIQAVPGVIAAGATSKLPLRGGTNGPAFTEEMIAQDPGGNGLLTETSTVAGEYFEAMGISLLAGRTLIPEDADEAAPGVVINQAAAQRFWPEQDPLGKRLSFGDDPPHWLTVVGVAGDVRQWSPGSHPRPEVYAEYLANPRTRMFITVSAAGDPRDLIRPVRQAVMGVDPNQPVSEIRTMGEIVDSQMAGREFYTLLIGLFSALALVLAAAGIYGVISYYVAQRTRELGVRVALGANRAGLVRLVARRALSLVVAGIFVGLAGMAVATLIVSSLLFGVGPVDLPTLAGGLGSLLAVGAAGAFIPSVRATRLSPVEALKNE
jgi:putative ABC transport system permease protein